MRGRARSRPVVLRKALKLAAAFVTWASTALGDEPQPSAERIKAAAEEFDRGRRAYLAKDFEQAAGHFENAFRDAPSKETLRLAIRARRDAKQLARAATLAAVAQQRYATDAPTAQLAKETLAEASPALSEYVVRCASPCTIAADHRVVSQSDGLEHRIFLEPGGHDLGVSFQQGGSSERNVEGRRGASTTLVFEPPPPPPPAQPTPTAEPPPAPVKVKGREKPLGPALFFVGAGVTVAAGAATIVSGIATQNDPGPDAVRRECVGRGVSCPLYQQGQDAETRSNILLGVTLGAAVVTGVVGLLFTQWSSSGTTAAPVRKRSTSPELALSPLGVGARF